MCLRYTLHEPRVAAALLARALGVPLEFPADTPNRYNVTLTHDVPAVVAREDTRPQVTTLRWGLLTRHEAQATRPRLMPNAKAETAGQLRSFREAVARRRCLIPANGFYEWSTFGREKLPHLFTLAGDEPFAFAGIWEAPVGEGPPTFALLTTRPNALVAPVHDRMPVILPAPLMAAWLGAEPLSEASYAQLTAPCPAGQMRARRVSTYVNSARHEGPACHAPPEAEPLEFTFD